jgi:hypothetical protein
MDTTSKAAPKTGHKHPPSTREQRGIALFREGAVSEHGDLFVVRGGSRKYTVSLDRETCTCPDFQARRSACKHQFCSDPRRGQEALPQGRPHRRQALPPPHGAHGAATGGPS